MRLSYLRAEGFRGIKDPIEIEIPDGFVVVSGRNGAGKSTFCDAVQFALTGSIGRSTESTERGETLDNYIWWRGEGDPKDRRVILGVVDDEGRETFLTRTPDGLIEEKSNGVRSLMVVEGEAPENFLEVLCQTAIIRDEEITRLSLDMKETERYRFVRRAIGAVELPGLTESASNAHEFLEDHVEKLTTEYDSARREVTRLVEQISETVAEASEESEISDAEDLVRDLAGRLGIDEAEATEALGIGRRALSEIRSRLSRLSDRADELESTQDRLGRIGSEDFERELNDLEKEVKELTESLEEERASLSTYQERLDEMSKRDPLARSLAQLLAAGEEIGLREGRCPLCGLEIKKDAYEHHLSVIEQELERRDATLTDVVRRRDHLRTKVNALEDKVATVTADLAQKREAKDTLQDQTRELLAQVADDGIEIQEDGSLADAMSAIQKQGEAYREWSSELDAAVGAIESSRALDRARSLEDRLRDARKIASSLEQRVNQAKDATQRAKDALDTIRRVEGEVIDERLAAISPLLSDLYFRLRPHYDWPELRYLIRGELQHFLSLEVGDGLNPRYLFSSGQRRAIGLAFLLAVNLSSTWSRFDPLILDDPIHHIDDFRALHLVELLSSIRRSGRQVICTVEDESLAALLIRRLRTGEESEGLHVQMEYEPSVGVRVARTRRILPGVERILEIPA